MSRAEHVGLEPCLKSHLGQNPLSQILVFLLHIAALRSTLVCTIWAFMKLVVVSSEIQGEARKEGSSKLSFGSTCRPHPRGKWEPPATDNVQFCLVSGNLAQLLAFTFPASSCPMLFLPLMACLFIFHAPQPFFVVFGLSAKQIDRTLGAGLCGAMVVVVAGCDASTLLLLLLEERIA